MPLSQRLKPSHLRLILRIAESGQLQVAASALGMSQPAASRMLAEIEDYAGTPLFQRHPKGMGPTQAGEAFVKHARVILTEIDNLGAEVASLKTGLAGDVRVGAVTGPAVGCLVPAIRSLRAQAPDLRATVEVAPSTALMRGLFEGRFDFALCRLPPDYDSRNFVLHPARTEPVSLIVRRGHRLDGVARIRMADLAGDEWIVQDRGSPIRQAVDEAFLGAGVPVPERITNTSSLVVALAFLEGSDAISPQSREVADLLKRGNIDAGLTTLDLADPIVVAPFFVIRRRYQLLPRAAERLLDEVLTRL